MEVIINHLNQITHHKVYLIVLNNGVMMSSNKCLIIKIMEVVILIIRQINNFMTKTKTNNKMISIMEIKSKTNIKKHQKRKRENLVGLHLLLLLKLKEPFNTLCNQTKFNSHLHLTHLQINLLNKNSIYRINKTLFSRHNLLHHQCLQVCLYLLSHRKCLVDGLILVMLFMQCLQYLVCQDSYHRLL